MDIVAILLVEQNGHRCVMFPIRHLVKILVETLTGYRLLFHGLFFVILPMGRLFFSRSNFMLRHLNQMTSGLVDTQRRVVQVLAARFAQGVSNSRFLYAVIHINYAIVIEAVVDWEQKVFLSPFGMNDIVDHANVTSRLSVFSVLATGTVVASRAGRTSAAGKRNV